MTTFDKSQPPWERWELLSEKIERSWETCQKNLYGRSPGEMIGMAEEIAATATCYAEFQCSGDELSVDTLAYLMQFEDPLAVVRDRWMFEQSADQSEKFQNVMETLCLEADTGQNRADMQPKRDEMTMQI